MIVYPNTCHAVFLRRCNRFAAEVMINGVVETVHVKNTGRLGELLLPGAEVCLAYYGGEHRKTKYGLISVRKEGLGWVNIDSQILNAAAGQWLQKQGFDRIQPEYTWGSSRFDFFMCRGEDKYLLEVKGCTLEVNGSGLFPDAVSSRAAKHCAELVKACEEGYHCYIAFVIAMNGVRTVFPNGKKDPKFEQALNNAVQSGVKILFLPCTVTENTIEIQSEERLWGEE